MRLNKAKNKITLLIAIHSHQPVGNFDWVFEEAYQKAYLPFIEVLKRHPRIKVALHYSGSLFDWFIKNKPEYMVVLKELVAKGQVEMMGGAYYEPILPLIPDSDKLGQVNMMSEFIKRNFGRKVDGAWLAERVWEPYLPKPFAQSNIKYTIVDDSHFEYAGIPPEEAQGFYLSEEQGHKLYIFPGSQQLRYLIPFREPEQTIDYLWSRASQSPCAVTYADDGEKFGLWPGTHEWVYGKRWLERFFKSLDENQDFIETMTPGEYLNREKPTGRVYLPCASYKEMLEWSGGYFKNFLVKYPEANNMHKKMLYVSDKLQKLTTKSPQAAEAKRQLYMGQCNCAYWHGIFGGLYLNHLRSSIYSHLISAENIIDDLSHKKEWITENEIDFDNDGNTEVLIETKDLNLYFDPQEGGSLFELDQRRIPANLTNVLMRRYESYHEKVKKKAFKALSIKSHHGAESIHDMVGLKEKNLEDYLVYDKHKRASLLDHFLKKGALMDDFINYKHEEMGDFIDSPYAFKWSKNKLVLERDGYLYQQAKKIPMTVRKTVDFDPKVPAYSVTYEIVNRSDQSVEANFGIEYNLSVKSEDLQEKGTKNAISNFLLHDQFFGVKLGFDFDKETNLWHFPVHTVSESEEGLEKTYQGLCLLFTWPLELAKGQKQKIWMKNYLGLSK